MNQVHPAMPDCIENSSRPGIPRHRGKVHRPGTSMREEDIFRARQRPAEIEWESAPFARVGRNQAGACECRKEWTANTAWAFMKMMKKLCVYVEDLRHSSLQTPAIVRQWWDRIDEAGAGERPKNVAITNSITTRPLLHQPPPTRNLGSTNQRRHWPVRLGLDNAGNHAL